MSSLRRILIVDDDERLLHVLARALEVRGYAVTRARTVPEALDALTADLVLILTDLHLGDRSGLELIAANEASARPVPIITMSGPTVGESAVDPGTRASVKAHLHKPFTIAALERAMGFLTRD